MAEIAATIIIAKSRNIIAALSKFLEAHCQEGTPDDASLDGIQLLSSEKTELISRSISISNTGLFDNPLNLSLLETFVLIFYEATPGRDFNFFHSLLTSAYVYMFGIADLLIRGKISLFYLEKKSMIDVIFNSDCYLTVVDPSPCGNHLDSYFDILKACVNSHSGKKAKVRDCMDYASRSFLFQDKRIYSGFLDAVNSLIQKGIFKRNDEGGLFQWIGWGSYYYKLVDKSLQEKIRNELRSGILENKPLSEFNSLLLCLLILGEDVHSSLFSVNKYLRGILSDSEMSENKSLLQKYKQGGRKM